MANWVKKLFPGKEEEEEEIIFKDINERTSTEAIPASSERSEREEAPANSSIEGNNIELKVVRPESINEAIAVADYLIAGCTVVLNLEALDEDIIERMLDFLNGVTYTMDGEIKNVAQNTYIITPGGIDVHD